MSRTARDEGVLVIGLGRFGAAIALTLDKLDTQVLAIDTDPDLVQKYSGQLTHVVRADATHPEVLEQVGAGDFRIAVVGVGAYRVAFHRPRAAPGEQPDALPGPRAQLALSIGTYFALFLAARIVGILLAVRLWRHRPLAQVATTAVAALRASSRSSPTQPLGPR